MLHYLALFVVLVTITYGKPLSTCSSQIACLDLDVSDVDELDSDGNRQYEICLYFTSSRDECKKDGQISHACPSEDEGDKIEGWEAGRENAMCNIVSCDQSTAFGIKDGSTCDCGDTVYYGDLGVDDYDLGNFDIYGYGASEGGYCGGGNKKQCKWLVNAPECDDDTTTSTTTEPTTVTDPTTVIECDETQEYVDCVGCPSVCGGPDMFVCNQQCVPGCKCKSEFPKYLESEGKCVAECPTTTTDAPCYCGDISAEGDPGKENCAAACGYGVCTVENQEGMDMCVDLDPQGFQVYIRDEVKDANSNTNFVMDTDTDTDTDTGNASHKLVSIISFTVSFIVYLY